MSSSWNNKRPMSPHLQVWRWHASMASSILHRATTIVSYVALFLVAIGLLCLSASGSLPLEGLIFSPLGAIGLFVFVFSFIFMGLAQLRHAIWDTGAMLEPNLNNTLSYVMIALAVVVALLVTVVGSGVLS